MTSQQPATSTADSAVRKLDLNLTQVSAAALAAITAAVLGSTIGVAGTVIGAALASIITTVSTTVYQHSLERSRQRVRVLAARSRPPAEQRATVGEVRSPRREAPSTSSTPSTPSTSSLVRRRGLRWTAVTAGSVAAFALAMTAITGFESAIGQALSGGEEPTIVRFTGDPQPSPEPLPVEVAPESSAAPTEGTPTPEPTSAGAPEPDTTATTGTEVPGGVEDSAQPEEPQESDTTRSSPPPEATTEQRVQPAG